MALKDTVIELAPHYVAMLILVTLVLAVSRFTVGDLGFWGEFVVVIVVVFSYPFAVRRLGYEPGAWER